MARHVGLVNPCPCQVQTCGQLACRLLQPRAAARFQSLAGHALEHDIFHAAVAAQLALVVAVTVLIHHQAVGVHEIECGQEIEVTVTLVDVRFLDIADGAHHEQAFLLAVHGLVPLQRLDGLVAADAHVQVTVLRCLPEEFHMSRVQQIVAP